MCVFYFCAAKEGTFSQSNPILTTVVKSIMIPGVIGLQLNKIEKEDLDELLKNHGDELEKAGIKASLEKLMEPQVEFSKVIIGRKVTLEEYGLEIPLSPLQIAVLVYLIKNPGGLMARWLVNEKDELLDYYNKVSVYDNSRLDEKTIDALVSESTCARKLSEQVSRINAAFKSVLKANEIEFYAPQYAIVSDNNCYRINLKESDVIWRWPFDE